MHRFYVPPDQCQSDLIALNEREAHHASHVLRLDAGDGAIVLDGSGNELQCRVESARKKSVELRVVKRVQHPSREFSLTLLQAIPKGKIIESIIQKATELGVARIIPLLTERVATRLDDADAENKAEKWQQVAVEAIKQCGAVWMPKVESPIPLVDLIHRGESFDLPFVASLQPGARHPRKWFQEFISATKTMPRSICVWIGPEGDFSADEVRAIEFSGAKPITLGDLVLRVETAAVYCLSLVNYELTSPRDCGTECGPVLL